jgi:hypothetical protein
MVIFAICTKNWFEGDKFPTLEIYRVAQYATYVAKSMEFKQMQYTMKFK